MITLFRASDSTVADRVQQRLEDLVVAHRVVVAGSDSESDEIPPSLPAIQDGERVVSGARALDQYLDGLEKLMADWNRFQTDACYVDDDGSVC